MNGIGFSLFLLVFIGYNRATGELYTPSAACSQEQTDANNCTGCPKCTGCIVWPTTPAGSCTYSRPYCFNAHHAPVERCCNSNQQYVQWDPAYGCNSFQVDLPECPDDFTYDDQIKICYKKSTGTYPLDCPYEETVSFETYKTILDTLLIDQAPFWMPVHRTGPLGFMVWDEASSSYMDLFTEPISLPATISGQDCLLYYNSSTFVSAKCSEVHSGICAYSTLTTTVKNSLCKSDKFCRQGDFSTKSKCFCVSYEPVEDKLVEFLKPYQNLLSPSLTTDACMIGLTKTGDKYVWSSGVEIDYGYWSSEASFGSGASYGSIYSDGWSLQLDKNSLPCYLYETETTKYEPKLNLEYDDQTSMFVLALEDVDGLKHDDQKPLVFCFTDATSYELVYKYGLTPIAGDKFTFAPHAKGPGNYWCEAFRYPDLDVIKSSVVFYRDPASGSEFVAVLRFNYVSGTDVLSQTMFEFFERVLFIKINNDHLESRIMEILALDETKNQVTLKVHLSSKIKRNDIDVEFDDIRGTVIAAIDEVKSLVVMDSFLSADYCITDTVDGITWETTPVGSKANSNKYCFSNGHLIQRKCEGSFMDGAKWESIPPCDIPKTSEVTDKLLDVLESNCSVKEMIQRTRGLSERYSEYVPLDLFLLSGILEKSSCNSRVNLMDLVDIIDNLHRIQDEVLNQAQFEMKATDRILRFVDEILLKSSVVDCDHLDGATTPADFISYLDQVNENEIFQKNPLTAQFEIGNKAEPTKNFDEDTISSFTGVNPCIERSLPHLEIHSENFIVAMANIKNTDITGLVVKGSETRYLYMDEDVLEQDLDLAVVFNHDLRNEIIANGGKVIIAIYTKDALFNEKSSKSVSEIVSVLFPGMTELSSPLTILFRNISAPNKTCSFWSYAQNASGTWAKETPSSKNHSLEACDFWHTTHFALLLTGSASGSNLDRIILEIITNISCGLSVFGLAAIILTAILFRRWRRNTGNQILINFSIAIFIEIAAFYASNAIKSYVSSEVLCTIIGIILHYSLISQFCWMFIIAVLQFRRFVEVLGGPPKYVLLKACLCGWVLPLLPVVCVYFLDQKNYVSGHVGLCYPSGLGLYLGVWLPIAIIVTINFVIFLYIIYNVVHRKTECTDMVNNDLLFQWRLGILLFFMLGLTWSFGLLTELNFGIVFVYLFCIAAPGQGFVMFLFFIVFNRSTRSLYVHSVKSYFSDSLSY